MSRTRTFVGRTKSFFRIDTFPFFYFLTEEILTTSFFGVIVKFFDKIYPVSAFRKFIILLPSS